MYSLFSAAASCFIWTFLTGIALNCARRGAFWPPLKTKYLPVFSLAGASAESGAAPGAADDGAERRAQTCRLCSSCQWFPSSPSGLGPSAGAPGSIDGRLPVFVFAHACYTRAMKGAQEVKRILYSWTVCVRGPLFIKRRLLFGSCFSCQTAVFLIQGPSVAVFQHGYKKKKNKGELLVASWLRLLKCWISLPGC